MRYTRRVFERHVPTAVLLATVVVGVTSPLALASCSSTEEVGKMSADDAGPEAAASATSDGSAPVVDAGVERDAAPFDGGPLPVVCESSPCATALVTTRGASDGDRAEGFCALLSDKTVACWGAGGAGQLGQGDEGQRADSSTAVRVAGLAGVTSLDHTCALDESGAVFCWGTGPFLQDPAVATTTELAPVKLDLGSGTKATKMAVGISTGCALVDGNVLCWGSNVHGEIAPLETTPATEVLAPQAVALPAGAPVTSLVVGHAAFALRADKSVVSWGANPPLARVSSLFPDPYPLPSVLGGVATIDLAEDNACAAANGVGYCWGTTPPPTYGVPDGEPRLTRALPAPVTAPEPIVQIATTRARTDLTPAQPQRWCAVSPSGNVYCWGLNDGGQAGDGTKNHAYDAVRVAGLPGPASQVSTTAGATCALLTSGKVFCWGTNSYGQLGNGRLKIASLVPEEVVLP